MDVSKIDNKRKLYSVHTHIRARCITAAAMRHTTVCVRGGIVLHAGLTSERAMRSANIRQVRMTGH
jgi:hypothetical protein